MRSSRGYALLLAILIANIVLAMSLGIFSIALKEVTLTTYLRDSQSAFAAADLGLECGLFWDMSYPQNGIINPSETIFATSTAYNPPANLDSAVCNGMQLDSAGAKWSVPAATLTSTGGITTFSLQLANGTCVDVAVSKVNDVISGISGTTVTSNGYNNCNPNNPRRTQRTLEVSKNL